MLKLLMQYFYNLGSLFSHKKPSAILYLLLIGISAILPKPLQAEEVSEYGLKALFLYNFAIFTSWPGSDIDKFNLCIYGDNPFGQDINFLMKSKKINERTIDIHRIDNVSQLDQCQLVFISRPMISNLADVITTVKDKPILTIADSPGACHQGVILNMNVNNEKVTFEANLMMAKKAGLNLSSQLLRLATEIYQ